VSTPASSPAALPALVAGTYSGTKPAEIDYSGDASNIVTKITWSSWTATAASGTGTSGVESCNPNCAQGPVKQVTTTITLSAPVNGKFTQMTETRDGKTESFTYPSQSWPAGAS
jgi:hypothetical protein